MKKRILLSTIGLITILNVSLALPVKADTSEKNNVQNANINTAVMRRYDGMISGTGVRLRKAPGTSSSVITTLSNRQRVTILEIGKKKINGYKWHKVRTESGQIGYVADAYVLFIA
ncbi:MAG: SH3 domain-containing protein [Clostridium argentinense]|uniref:SH3 domain-containing protein n=1 Tax=Clostridium faecium TaxID=2762223 RepID=A0ABR8YND7_9CLOT|nr:MULTISPECIES: SH3 domain-containing protein [Clostridium]MBD8045760.1 SH3 domain-containing protein [Clostridium faecium]MBS5824516.1 SH3 domain-containing protein [Clostridium argentinense]MDU1348352.1 SH3 domain-containing protein [Clostridium argentinense]